MSRARELPPPAPGAIVKLGTAHVVLVLDASPSMGDSGFRDPAIQGVNDQVEALRATSATRTTCSLLQFDQQVRPTFEGVDLGKVKRLTRAQYDPQKGSGTALYDGVHASIDLLEPELQDNETALVIVVTDGEENCSKRYDVADLARRVTKKQMTGRWTFTLLGPRRTVEETARAMAIPPGNVRTFEQHVRSLEAGLRETRDSIGRYMDARTRGVAATDGFYLPPKS